MSENFGVRRAAHNSLMKIHTGERYSNIEIDSFLKQCNFSDADRGLYTRLVYGVIERALTLDHIISQYSARKVDSLDKATLTALRLGIYQCVYMDKIPEFAAVSESVDTAPAKAKGYVNGVLRSFLRQKKKFTLPEEKSVKALSVKYSVSEGVAKILLDSYGEEKCEGILKAFFVLPSVTLRVNTEKTTVEALAEKIPESKIGSKGCDTLWVPTLSEKARKAIENGECFVQDEASRMCTLVLGAKEGERIADVCAAPGGKSFSAAIDMKNKGELYSFDLHENKLSLIRKSAERLGLSIIRTAERDARNPDEALLSSCDRVLCDVPCSGIGVLGKKPEIRYKADFSAERLPKIQFDILKESSAYVKENGVLVYSTCTLNRHENEEVVTKFLSECESFVPEEFSVHEKRSENGMLTVFPDSDGTDGFFIAKLRKVK